MNEKIEGFFDICKARGLQKMHGVIIPESNIKHLMLREDVVKAVDEGLFHVYSATHIDEVMELLTGVEAGEADAKGNYKAGTINNQVLARLELMNKNRVSFMKSMDEKDEGKD